MEDDKDYSIRCKATDRVAHVLALPRGCANDDVLLMQSTQQRIAGLAAADRNLRSLELFRSLELSSPRVKLTWNFCSPTI